MCGLSGHHGIKDQETRLKLIIGLGAGIDNRGGHASGFISSTKDKINYCKRIGKWIKSKQRFLNTAASGDICLMHARWATCGVKESISQAHPFAIKRKNQVVLWGAHNGMVPNAWDSAKSHGREIEVDSQEIFELLADKDYEGIRKLNGYGVITWIEAENRNHVNIVKLSNHADICVMKTTGGGVVWASTQYILSEGLKLAGLTAESEYKDLEVGRVHQIRADGLYKTAQDGITVGDMWGKSSTLNNHQWQKDYDFDGEDGWYPKYSATKTTVTDTKPSVNDTSRTARSYDGYTGYVPLCDGLVERVGGTKEWYKGKELHRDDGPARVTKDGDQEFFINGKRHRLDGPAVERKNGTKEYWQDGQRHRISEPAVEWTDGTKEWWYKGQKHRLNGPAVEKMNGDKEWWQNDKRHRVGDPAIEKANGDYSYYYLDQYHREDGPALRFQNKKSGSPPWEGYWLYNKYFKTKEDWEIGLANLQETRKRRDDTVSDKMNEELIAFEKELEEEEKDSLSKDHAFMREMRLIWEKQAQDDEVGDEPEKTRFLTKGM